MKQRGSRGILIDGLACMLRVCMCWRERAREEAREGAKQEGSGGKREGERERRDRGVGRNRADKAGAA